MPTKVTMPQLGESVIEGTVTKWLKAVGDPVEEYEPLLEVNTDKVDSEIPSPSSGTLLEILVPEGTTVQAGDLLALIGEQGKAPQATSAPTTPAQEETKAGPDTDRATSAALESDAGKSITQPTVGRSELGFISPVVAKIAAEHNLDLGQISGTGQGGRITKKDVLAYLERKPAAPTPTSTPTDLEPPAQPLQPKTEALVTPSVPAPTPGEILPLTPVRRAIADHMVLSKHTSPHVTTVMEADLSRVVKHREAHKEAFAREGINLTFTAYFISAIVAGLKAYPIVNSSWSDEGIRIHRQINIGMATALGEGGLIVPVIKDADGLSLRGLARSINDLAQRARNKQLQPQEVKGGTFTLTNHGTSGSLFASPIINQPQCGILGVGAIQKRVVVIDDAIAIRPMAYLTLTFDHRILDGAIADYFLGAVVKSLQLYQGG
ncbi:MAG: dihydrolipoamide acetyltransferase family protein [Anaerolineales bacterium]|jgi:2-oxoglutarate dehydrogenase dihydrolipoamide succinyltransferase (E2 component)